MSTSPALPFEVVETERGRLYRLPPRQLGWFRLLALVPLVIVAVCSTLLAQFYIRDVAPQPAASWYWAVFVVLLLVWAVIVYLFLDLAASIWCGHSEIEVAPDGTVRTYDRAGWFCFPLCKIPPGDGVRLILTEISGPPNPNGPLPRWAPPALWQLSAEGKKGERGWVAIGYPREILAALAEQLSRELAVAPPGAVGETAPPVAVPVFVEGEGRDVLKQPSNSYVKLERHPDGITITVPPLGVAKAYSGLVYLGSFLSIIGGTGLCVAIVLMFGGNPQAGILIGIPTVVFSAGVACTLVAVHVGRMRVVLAVVGNQLLTFQTGPLGSRRREFARDSLLDIACGPSKADPGGKPLPQLQIVAPNTRVGMLTGRDEQELKWIATVLRQALGIPSEAPGYRKTADAPRPWSK